MLSDCLLYTSEIETVKGQDVVFVCVQTGYHQDVLAKILPHLEAGQIVVVNPGYLSTAYAIGIGIPEGVIIAEAESSFIDGRIMEPGRFKVGFRNVRNPIGIYPCLLYTSYGGIKMTVEERLEALEKELQQIKDVQAIKELKSKYFQALDTKLSLIHI